MQLLRLPLCEQALVRIRSEVSQELVDDLVGLFSPHVIRSEVVAAVNDLSGSVSAEALPEMAARLAHHRLMQQPMRVDRHTDHHLVGR